MSLAKKKIINKKCTCKNINKSIKYRLNSTYSGLKQCWDICGTTLTIRWCPRRGPPRPPRSTALPLTSTRAYSVAFALVSKQRHGEGERDSDVARVDVPGGGGEEGGGAGRGGHCGEAEGAGTLPGVHVG